MNYPLNAQHTNPYPALNRIHQTLDRRHLQDRKTSDFRPKACSIHKTHDRTSPDTTPNFVGHYTESIRHKTEHHPTLDQILLYP